MEPNTKEVKESLLPNTSKKAEIDYPSVSFFKLQYYFSDSTDRFFMFLGVIGSFGTGAAMPLFSVIFGNTIDSFSESKVVNPNSFIDQINGMVMKYIYIGSGVFFTSFLMITFFTIASKRMIKKIKNKYLETILKQEQGFFDQSNVFEYATKVQTQTKTIESGIGDKVGNSVRAFVMFILAFLVGFITSWQLSLALVAVMPFLGAGGYFLGKTMQNSFKINEKSYEKAGGIAEEVIYNIKTVASFGNLNEEKEKFDNLVEKCMIEGIKGGLKNGLLTGTMFFLIYFSYAVAVFYGSYLISAKITNYNNGKPFKAGDVLTVIFSIVFGAMALGTSGPNFKSIADAVSSSRELFWLINRKPLIDLTQSKKILEKEKIKGEITFKNVSFSYPSDPTTMILKNINIHFEEGKKIAIVGKSGSGKSTIVNLIERFYDLNNGEISVDGINIKELDLKYWRSLIGYVSQEPVLFNVSIKENIDFGRGLTDEDIRSAAEKANALEFINKIDKKFDYQVGVKGGKLSGGQKQRIAIARAIAHRPKILILDEATSALDNTSEKIVQKALDRVSSNITTIIIAHRLSTVKNADKIIVLEQGKIVEIGNHEELINLNGFYSDLVKNQLTEKEYFDKRESISSVSTEKKIIVEEKEIEEEKIVVVESAEDLKKKKQEEKQIQEKLFKESRSKLISLLVKHKCLLLFSAIFASISGAVWPFYGILLGKTISKLSEPVSIVFRDGRMMSYFFVGLALIAAFAILFQTYLFGRIGEILTKTMRSLCYNKFLSLHIGYFDSPNNNPGNLLTRLSSDTTKINAVALTMVGVYVQAVVMLIIGLTLGFYYSWQISLINIGFVPLIFLSSAMQFKANQGFIESNQDNEAEAGALLSESVTNTKTVFSYNMEGKICDLYNQVQSRMDSKLWSSSLTNGILYGFSQFIMFMVYAVLFYSGGQFIKKGDITASNMYNAIFAILMSAFGIGMTQMYVKDYAQSKEALVNLCKIVDQKSEIDPFEKKEKIIADPQKFMGKIEFCNVSFAYPTRKEQIVFKNLSFNINPGQSVAFVGPSGSGKSTIVQLIERFYDVDEGKILIDDIDIRDYDLISYRKCISLVMQEPVLFKRSLIENIRYGKLSATNEEVIESAKKAYINDLLESSKDNALPVSGGEKQRVAIARSIIKNPRILLLDEATSALDKNSEEIVQKALDEVSVGRTTIAIAHRLSTVKNCEVIHLIENGVIQEKGNHAELIEMKGKYYHLYFESVQK